MRKIGALLVARVYRSSEIESTVTARHEPNVIRYRALPASNYEVRSVVIGAGGQERAMVSQAATVLSLGR